MKFIDILQTLIKKANEALSSRFKDKLPEDIRALMKQIALVLVGCYFLATIVASLIVPIIMKPVLASSTGKKQAAKESAVTFSSNLAKPNFRDIKKAVIDRNIFNSEGQYPDESADTEPALSMESEQIITETSPCTLSKLSLTLIGTIYLGSETTSTASIREKGLEEADIYKVGDSIIGFETVFVHNIFRNRVVLDNDGKKECLDLEGGVPSFMGKPLALTQKKQPESAPLTRSAPVVLQSSWVESQLGEGFSKIIGTVRLVPHTTPEGTIQGFRIFNIEAGSLMDRVGFKDGDVITKVNETVINEQAFALYEAFLSDKEVSIQLLRNGTTPTTIDVQIK